MALPNHCRSRRIRACFERGRVHPFRAALVVFGIAWIWLSAQPLSAQDQFPFDAVGHSAVIDPLGPPGHVPITDRIDVGGPLFSPQARPTDDLESDDASNARHRHPNRPFVQRPQQTAPLSHDQVGTDQSLWNRPHLTGDWFGLRSRLSDGGISFDSSLTIDTSRNFQGGLDTSKTLVRQLFDANATIDTERLFGWKGGTVFVDYQHQSGPYGAIIAGDAQGGPTAFRRCRNCGSSSGCSTIICG